MKFMPAPEERDSKLPRIHYFGEVDSTLDAAFRLAEEGRLPDWSSVVARSQSAGRGQMRRRWDSPPGNLYATLRLPLAAPFDSCAAPVIVGALCANALRGFGCPAQLKWPNDLVVEKMEGPAKLGGILLEERNGCLLAGIGVNVAIAPDIFAMREDCALPPANLKCGQKDGILPGPAELWQALARHIYSLYKSGSMFSQIWRETAEELLLWRGEPVIMEDGRRRVRGILKGIGEKGGAILEMGDKSEEITSGGMRLWDGTACADDNEEIVVAVADKRLVPDNPFER